MAAQRAPKEEESKKLRQELVCGGLYAPSAERGAVFVSAILVGDLRLERRRQSVNWERDSHIATSSSAVDETVRAPPSGPQKSFPWLEQNQFHTTRASDDSIR